MRAMVLPPTGSELVLQQVPVPSIERMQVLIRVHACGVCRTDLHIVDGELLAPIDVFKRRQPLIPGHEIIGTVVDAGPDASWAPGTRVGVPWLASSCGQCIYCRGGLENLCELAQFTGFHVPGGYADYVQANSAYCFEVPDSYSDVAAAPMMCAGLIGLRALRLAGDVRRLGLYGFGASAHILAQIARHEGREVFAFTRAGDTRARSLATQVGATWVGSSTECAPSLLDAAILFAPDGALVPTALRAVRKGGVVVCTGIHMSLIPAFPYELLWGERVLRSVANLTRRDGLEFFTLARQFEIRTTTQHYPLPNANLALQALRSGSIVGAAVLLNTMS